MPLTATTVVADADSRWRRDRRRRGGASDDDLRSAWHNSRV